MSETDEIMDAWDDLDIACNRIITALPFQMTEAAAALEVARRRMRAAVQASYRSPRRVSPTRQDPA